MPSRFISPPEIAPANGYTHVVEVTNSKMIFISGQVPLDLAGNLVGADNLLEQTQQVFKNLQSALTAAGTDFNHVVKFTYFLLDISQIPVVRTVRDQYINTAQPPASSAVEVRKLFREGILIEVEAIAAVPL
ncbi:MAG: RidA family protein [Chloroflexi bacterium]|nr:RidA family protein [Chloroflexota bacterium]MCC6893349.1 RidA family protein [Anaerolineae bacterium]